MLTRSRLHIVGASLGKIGAVLGIAAVIDCSVAVAADFVVSPLTVVFENAVRSGQIIVRNEGSAEVRFDLHAKDWTQGDGADKYTDSESLIYFPRAMAIPPGESRIIRVGIKANPADTEHAFRLFIEELPARNVPGALAASSAQLQILLNVGVPIFARPPRGGPQAEIENLLLDAGKIRFGLRNSGNEHFKATSIELVGTGRDGTEKFRRTIEDRYYLAGTAKSYSEPIPYDACAELATIEVTVVAEQFTLRRKLDVSGPGCR